MNSILLLTLLAAPAVDIDLEINKKGPHIVPLPAPVPANPQIARIEFKDRAALAARAPGVILDAVPVVPGVPGHDVHHDPMGNVLIITRIKGKIEKPLIKVPGGGADDGGNISFAVQAFVYRDMPIVPPAAAANPAAFIMAKRPDVTLPELKVSGDFTLLPGGKLRYQLLVTNASGSLKRQLSVVECNEIYRKQSASLRKAANDFIRATGMAADAAMASIQGVVPGFNSLMAIGNDLNRQAVGTAVASNNAITSFWAADPAATSVAFDAANQAATINRIGESLLQEHREKAVAGFLMGVQQARQKAAEGALRAVVNLSDQIMQTLLIVTYCDLLSKCHLAIQVR